jgi:hypothetical protein
MAQATKNRGNAVFLATAITLAVITAAAIRRRDTGPGDYEPDPMRVTLTDEQVRYIASEIYTAVWGTSGWSLTEDEATVIRVLSMANTDDDIMAISKAYGCRAPQVSIGCMTLRETIVEFLDPGERDLLNSQLARKGVTIRY